jgi:hypothetical protein
MISSLDNESIGLMPSSLACSLSPERCDQPYLNVWYLSPEAHLMLLRCANESPTQFLELIIEDTDDEEKLLGSLSEHQKYQAKTKIMILIFALLCTEQHMPGKTWRYCCEEAIRQAHELGLTSVKILRQWSFGIGSFEHCESF